MSESALAVLEDETEKPSALMRKATDVASVCSEIVKRTAMEIKGRKFVKVEGWCSIAAAYGCVPSIKEVTEDEHGIRAFCELKRSDGTVVASAFGFVGNDEPTWSSRARYAREAMAQTRSISRVCRTAFAFVVVMIDSSLSTTPAEEIPSDGETFAAKPVSAVRVVNGDAAPAPVRSKETTVKFGKSKGKDLSEIDDADLAWQLAAAQKSVEAKDPRWHAANVAWAERVLAESVRRNG
jgi:hypothetical protein